jgi:hypothetical protein
MKNSALAPTSRLPRTSATAKVVALVRFPNYGRTGSGQDSFSNVPQNLTLSRDRNQNSTATVLMEKPIQNAMPKNWFGVR